MVSEKDKEKQDKDKRKYAYAIYLRYVFLTRIWTILIVDFGL